MDALVAIFTLHPYLPRRVNGTISYILLTLIAGFAVSYLSFARNLAYRRVLYSTQASILLYLVWWTISAYAYTHQILGPSAGWLGSNASWKGIGNSIACQFIGSLILVNSHDCFCLLLVIHPTLVCIPQVYLSTDSYSKDSQIEIFPYPLLNIAIYRHAPAIGVNFVCWPAQ